MSGLWRNNPETPEGKYLVIRRDGTVPDWPWFVLGAGDPAAPVAIRAYADEAERLGMDQRYINDLREMALQFEDYSAAEPGNPDGGPDRKDCQIVIAMMQLGQSA